MKSLIDLIKIYPVGTYIRSSTGKFIWRITGHVDIDQFYTTYCEFEQVTGNIYRYYNKNGITFKYDFILRGRSKIVDISKIVVQT